MKPQYVPLEKRSKKQQKEFHVTQRKTWGNMSPVTKAVPSAKLHNKKKARQWKHDSTSGFYIRACSHYKNVQICEPDFSQVREVFDAACPKAEGTQGKNSKKMRKHYVPARRPDAAGSVCAANVLKPQRCAFASGNTP